MDSPGEAQTARLPRVLLGALLLLQVVLAARQLAFRDGFPPRTNHFGFKNVLELRRLFAGYEPTWPLVHPGRTTHFFLDPERIDWWRPGVWLEQLSTGNLRLLFQNHADVPYWIEMPHPFALATGFGAVVGWEVWLIPLVFTGYLLVLLGSLYGLGEELDGPWTGLTAAAIAGGMPALFGFGRLIHDVLPLAALTTLAAWMLVRSRGFSRAWPCVIFGIAVWSALRSGESFYGSVLCTIVLIGPFISTLVERVGQGLDKASVRGICLAVGIPALSFDWWWFGPSHAYLSDEDPFADVLMQAEVADWVGESMQAPLEHGAYLVTMCNDLIRPPLMIFVLLGLLFLWRSPARGKLAMALMFGLPFFALSWMTRKSNWYILPCLPPLALMVAMGLRGLPGGRRVQRLCMGLAAAMGLTMLLHYSLSSDAFRRTLPQWVDRPFKRLVVMREVELTPYQEYPGRIIVGAAKETVDALDRVIPVDGKDHNLALFCQDQFWAWTFKYMIEMRRFDVQVTSVIHINLLEHYAGELYAKDFDMLVHLGEHGIETWQPSASGLPSTLRAPLPEGNIDHFGRFLRELGELELTAERTHQAPVYRMGD
jgi:hypothetical protein